MIRHGFSPPGERTDTDSLDNTNTEIIEFQDEVVFAAQRKGKQNKEK